MRKLPNVFNREQILQLLNTIDEPWLMVAVMLGIFCGLRRREVTNLRVQDIDLSTKRLRVENSKNPNRTYEGYGKDRVVPLPDCLITVLQRWIQLLGNDAYYLFPGLSDSLKPITGEHLWRVYKKALIRANLNTIVKHDAIGLPRHQFNFHTLRHTYATLLWERTGDILTVKSALGHAKIETTMIYTHVTNRVIEQKVHEAFSPKISIPKIVDGKMDPMGILMRRLAMGEIDASTFKQLREALRREQTDNVYIG